MNILNNASDTVLEDVDDVLKQELSQDNSILEKSTTKDTFIVDENVDNLKSEKQKNALENSLHQKNVLNKNNELVDMKNVEETTNDLDDNLTTNIKDISIDEEIPDSDYETNSIKEMDSDTSKESFDGNSREAFDGNDASETFYDKFITNLEKSLGLSEKSIMKEVSHLKEMQEIVNQVVDKIKIHINKDMTTMKLNLNPEHLGKVELEVTSKSGILTADFVVENETAKEALEKGLPALIEKFNEQGLKVEAIEVSISDYDFTRQEGERKNSKDYDSEDKKKKRNSKISMDDIGIDTEKVEDNRQIMSNQGVDYTV